MKMRSAAVMSVAAALSSMCLLSTPAGAAPAPAPDSPNMQDSGIPRIFKLMQPDPPSCIYYIESGIERGGALDASNCLPDRAHLFTRIITPENWLRLELTDYPGRCLSGVHIDPFEISVDSCDSGTQMDWGGGGSIGSMYLYARANPGSWLHGSGLGVVLKKTSQPEADPGFKWDLKE